MKEQRFARTIEWLNKLVVLAQYDQKLPFYLALLFKRRSEYEKALDLIRSAPIKKELFKAEPLQSDGVTVEEWDYFYRYVVLTPPLRELFSGTGDPFSEATHDEMALLSEISDLTTDSQSTAYSKDDSFLGILELLRTATELDVEGQILNGIERFLSFYETYPEITEMLGALAGSDHWQTVLASLRDRRDYTDARGASAAELLREWNQHLTPALREQIFKPNFLSKVPKCLIKLCWDARGHIDEARQIATDAVAPQQVYNGAVADAMLPLLREHFEKELEQVESAFELLATVARHYIQVRKFAKLDAFVYAWPRIARLGMSNYSNLQFVEDYLVRRRQPPTDADLDARDARELYELCVNANDLKRFLRLKPYFDEISQSELSKYKPLVPVVVEDVTESIGSGFIPPPAKQEIKGTPVTTTPAGLRLCEISIRKPTKEEIAQSKDWAYQVTLSGFGNVANIRFTPGEILKNMLASIGVKAEHLFQGYLKDIFANSASAGEELLARGGTYLQNVILPEGEMRQQYIKFFEEPQHVRVVITTNDEELITLPWEWLPNPNNSELLVRDPRFSVVRSSIDIPDAVAPTLFQPLRLVAILPSPPSALRRNISASVRSLESAVPREQLLLVTEREATLSRVSIDVGSFGKLVHFEGQVGFLPGDTELKGRPQVMFPAENGGSDVIDSEGLAEKLNKGNVQLVVIGNNDAPGVIRNAVASLAADLLGFGIPAIVAPARGIDAAAASTFTTELYRSFLEGNNLEVAVSVARRKLSSKGGDWSSFALFANPRVLDFFYAIRASA